MLTAVDEAASAIAERILIVDDEPDIARLVELALTPYGYDLAVASHGEHAVAKALAFRPDLVVLDIVLPGIDGLEICRRLRGDSRTADASIIMLTALDETADRVGGLGAGADDYLGKPFHPEELVARVQASLRRARQLRGLSPLTGLPGNFDITRELDVLTADPDARFALVHADLDGFKAYNDHYGFLRGDEAIKTTAQLLLSTLAEVGGTPRFAGHIGGDDFAIILSADVAAGYCDLVCERFDDLVVSLYDPADAARGFVEVEDRQGWVSRVPLLALSLGVVSNVHRRLTSATEVSSIASEMKRLAKATEGSCWRVDRRCA